MKTKQTNKVMEILNEQRQEFREHMLSLTHQEFLEEWTGIIGRVFSNKYVIKLIENNPQYKEAIDDMQQGIVISSVYKSLTYALIMRLEEYLRIDEEYSNGKAS